MQPKIVFVILHYLAIKETIDCLTSIEKNISYDNYDVIIVDNGSKVDQDVVLLKQQELKFTNVKVIISDENLGFARGNNIGFLYAKNNLQADFIVLINNDTIISQPDFCDVIVEKFKKFHYAAMGPKIITKDGRDDSNPIAPSNYTTKALYRHLLVLCILYLSSFFHLDVKIQYLIEKIRLKKKAQKESKYTKDSLGLKLHGSCLIFSREYINHFDGLNPNTFLYMEEDILFVRLKKNGLKSLYSPDLEILHLEDAATNMIIRKGATKRRFIYRNHLKSIQALIKEVRK